MIYVVRHGQTDWNLKKIYQGRKDIQLNNMGLEQAKELKSKLKNVQFDYVFSSPLTRALQTARTITNQNIIIDERLIERCNGEFEGKSVCDCPTNYDFNNPNDNRYGIENITVFKKKITSFLKELQSKYINKNILIVSHAGVIIYIREYFEGKPKNNDFDSYKIKNCQILTYNNEN